MQMPQISSNDTEKFKIPVPSLEIQSRIVQVLDNFDTVCNDLNIGLPKEIELRQNSTNIPEKNSWHSSPKASTLRVE